jgi:hypothetical protein
LPNIYTNQPYFRTVEPPGTIKGKYEMVPTQDVFQKRYLDYHDDWLRGEKRLPCFSIFRSAIVYPEGDLYFCHHRQKLLGNLHEQSMDEIWDSKRTKEIQKEHLYCNKCWCIFHRLSDVYAEPLGKMVLFPRRIRDILRVD